MTKLFSRRGDWMYIGIALVLFILLVIYAIYAVSFVAENVNKILEIGENGGGLIVSFDFDKLNQLVGNVSPPSGP
ncbi:MAG: hypothetical protein AAB518_02755 [Patescibacteria group bacterium]